MDQQEANNRIDQLGFILLLDAPAYIQLGIDNTSWTIGTKFKGIKLIPLGSHIVYYSLKSENYMFKLSFFVNLTKENNVHIRKWNEKYEDFIPIDEVQFEYYKQSLINMEFDKFLGAYPHDRYKIWLDVSNYIDQNVLDKLNPIENRMFECDQEYTDQKQEDEQRKQKLEEAIRDLYGEEFDPEELEKQSKKLNLFENEDEKAPQQKKEQKEQSEIDDFKSIAGTIYYSEVPKRQFHHGIKGENLTKLNFDKTELFKKYLKKNFNDDYKLLFGEFQYSFIMFLLAENLDSLEHWKNLFVLLTGCQEMMKIQPQIFVDLIPVIYGQLKQFPKDFFIDSISKDNFMKQALQGFIELCENQNQNQQIYKRSLKLKEMLQKNFYQQFEKQVIINENGKYQFDVVDEDDPVIVELNQEQIEYI